MHIVKVIPPVYRSLLEELPGDRLQLIQQLLCPRASSPEKYQSWYSNFNNLSDSEADLLLYLDYVNDRGVLEEFQAAIDKKCEVEKCQL